MTRGETLLVYDAGNQTADVRLAKGDPTELHDYEVDGAEYQKYEAWTDTGRSGRPEEWERSRQRMEMLLTQDSSLF